MHIQKTKMRMSRSYSNLNRTEKLVWDEYRKVRADRLRLEIMLSHEPEPKPRFKFDLNENRPRPIVHVTRFDEINKEYMKRGYRLLELALYLYAFGYIAPDFTSSDLENKRV